MTDARGAEEPARSATALSPVTLHCRDCPLWYGEEDRGWGPCSIKHQRGDERYLTFGGHLCDEGYEPPAGLGEKAASFKGERSTSKGSAVGYSSTSKAGKGSRRAKPRSRSAPSSTRRRSRSTT